MEMCACGPQTACAIYGKTPYAACVDLTPTQFAIHQHWRADAAALRSSEVCLAITRPRAFRSLYGGRTSKD